MNVVTIGRFTEKSVTSYSKNAQFFFRASAMCLTQQSQHVLQAMLAQNTKTLLSEIFYQVEYFIWLKVVKLAVIDKTSRTHSKTK